jgi:peptidoglycan/LPS O-acetylase OafA/YrhL
MSCPSMEVPNNVSTTLHTAGFAPDANFRDQPAYRPDIDGLRAVAIGTVVLYHAFPAAMPGGFIGVDIFFVISGFLISGIVFTQMEEGRFSFREFYVRRACRIFPALVLVLSLTCIVGWMWLLPSDWLRLGQEVRGGAFFFANFVFLNQAGYFDQTSVLKPLLHLWSLAIEEQFYFAWPLAVLLTYRNRALLPLILTGMVASFVLNIAQIAQHPISTFYLPTTRAWELLVGCLLAYRVHFAQSAVGSVFSAFEILLPSELRALFGLALIVAGVVLFDSHQLFPGWRALIPTLGAAFLISAGPAAKINQFLLANPPMIFVGLISYPLYLWHWPILSFATIYNGGTLGIEERLILIALAIGCSVLTFYLIERPIRFGTFRRRKAAMLAALCATLGSVGHLIAWNDVPSNASRFGIDRIVAAAGEWAYPTPDLVDETYHGQLLRKFKDAVGKNAILFFGDSNMEMYWPRIEILATQRAIANRDTIYFLTYGGCPPSPGITEVQHPYCAGFVDTARALIHERDIRTVVIAAHWWSYFGATSNYEYEGVRLSKPQGNDEAMSALADMVRSMVADRRNVYVILNIPYADSMDPTNMFKRHLTSFEVSSTPALLSDRQVALTERMGRLLRAAGATTIDPLAFLCDSKGMCPTTTPTGDPLYRDIMHLRPSYVRSNVFYLDRVFE